MYNKTIFDGMWDEAAFDAIIAMTRFDGGDGMTTIFCDDYEKLYGNFRRYIIKNGYTSYIHETYKHDYIMINDGQDGFIFTNNIEYMDRWKFNYNIICKHLRSTRNSGLDFFFTKEI